MLPISFFSLLMLLGFCTSIVTTNSALAQVVNEDCTSEEIGTSRMSTDRKNIVACLIKDTGTGQHWKAFVTQSPIVTQGYLTTPANAPSGHTPGKLYTVNLTVPEGGAVLNTTCSGEYRYAAEIGENAGTLTNILIDGVSCSKDLAFEAQSYSVRFPSSTTCIRPLSAGTHVLNCKISAHGHDGGRRETYVASSLGFVLLKP